jgi:hypothetical protein
MNAPRCLHPPIDFVAQLANHSPLGFKAQTKKPSRWFWGLNPQTVAVDFEVQTEKPDLVVLRPNHWQTVPVVLWSNHWQTVALSFETQAKNLTQRFRGQTTDKPSTLVLRLNQETCSPRLLMHSVDCIQCHPTSRPSGHRLPDLCLTIPGPLHQVSYSYHDPVTSRHAAPITCTPWDKQTQFSSRIKGKGKTIEMSQIWIQTSASQWLITIKPRHWPLGFSISPLMSTLTAKSTKFKFQVQDPMKHS